MPGSLPCFTIQIDERTETMRLAADYGHHQGQTQYPGTGERRRRAADSDPDWQRILQGSWVDALPGERGAMFAGPVDIRVVANRQEQLELLGEQRVVVFDRQAE